MRLGGILRSATEGREGDVGAQAWEFAGGHQRSEEHGGDQGGLDGDGKKQGFAAKSAGAAKRGFIAFDETPGQDGNGGLIWHGRSSIRSRLESRLSRGGAGRGLPLAAEAGPTPPSQGCEERATSVGLDTGERGKFPPGK